MLKKVLVALVVLGTLAFCARINSPQYSPDTTFKWAGDVAMLNVTGLDGTGTCSGWMVTSTDLMTAGHCAEQLISVTACFYPEMDCVKPIPLSFVGARYATDTAVFRLPKGMHKRPFFVRDWDLVPGERVYAVGYPKSHFAITDGVFSARIPAQKLWKAVYTEWLQVSTPTAPGSSGGALLDSRGRLVGMTIGAESYAGTVYVRFASCPADVIATSYFSIIHSAPAAPTVGVIGPPTITKGNLL